MTVINSSDCYDCTQITTFEIQLHTDMSSFGDWRQQDGWMDAQDADDERRRKESGCAYSFAKSFALRGRLQSVRGTRASTLGLRLEDNDQ